VTEVAIGVVAAAAVEPEVAALEPSEPVLAKAPAPATELGGAPVQEAVWDARRRG